MIVQYSQYKRSSQQVDENSMGEEKMRSLTKILVETGVANNFPSFLTTSPRFEPFSNNIFAKKISQIPHFIPFNSFCLFSPHLSGDDLVDYTICCLLLTTQPDYAAARSSSSLTSITIVVFSSSFGLDCDITTPFFY